MKRITISPIIAVAAPLLLLAACSGDAAPDAANGEEAGDAAPADGEPAEIAQRHDTYEAISDAFKVIRTELDTSSPDLTKIEAEAASINEKAQGISELFPAGTSVDDGYDTEALATIWEKPEEFTAATQALIDASAEMQSLAAAGDLEAVKAQVGVLGKSCKDCHDNFRLDTD